MTSAVIKHMSELQSVLCICIPRKYTQRANYILMITKLLEAVKYFSTPCFLFYNQIERSFSITA